MFFVIKLSSLSDQCTILITSPVGQNPARLVKTGGAIHPSPVQPKIDWPNCAHDTLVTCRTCCGRRRVFAGTSCMRRETRIATGPSDRLTPSDIALREPWSLPPDLAAAALRSPRHSARGRRCVSSRGQLWPRLQSMPISLVRL